MAICVNGELLSSSKWTHGIKGMDNRPGLDIHTIEIDERDIASNGSESSNDSGDGLTKFNVNSSLTPIPQLNFRASV